VGTAESGAMFVGPYTHDPIMSWMFRVAVGCSHFPLDAFGTEISYVREPRSPEKRFTAGCDISIGKDWAPRINVHGDDQGND